MTRFLIYLLNHSKLWRTIYSYRNINSKWVLWADRLTNDCTVTTVRFNFFADLLLTRDLQFLHFFFLYCLSLGTVVVEGPIIDHRDKASLLLCLNSTLSLLIWLTPTHFQYALVFTQWCQYCFDQHRSMLHSYWMVKRHCRRLEGQRSRHTSGRLSWKCQKFIPGYLWSPDCYSFSLLETVSCPT